MKTGKYVLIIIFLIFSCSKEQSNTNNENILNETNKSNIEECYIKYPSLPMIYESISNFYIGKDITEYNIDSRYSIVIDSNALYSYFLVNDNNFIYKISYSQNIIKYIIINDNSLNIFETPEGIKIGMTLSELRNKFPDIKIYRNSGFGYFGELPSGWKIGFFTGQTATEYYPKNDEKIKTIFKGGRSWL